MTDEETALIERMRTWLYNTVWRNRDDADVWVDKAPPEVILRGITRHYDGGIDAFVTAHLWGKQ